MSRPRILLGCEESGIIRDEFIKIGWDAISCDLKPTKIPGPHYQGDIFDIIDDGFDMMIAHPPCTYLTVTANKWMKDQPARKSGALVGQERREAMAEAKEFFIKLFNARIKRICLENPVGVMSTSWRKPDQIIQPYQFGHVEPKKTCLWLKNLPGLLYQRDLFFEGYEQKEPEYHTTKSGKRMPKWYAFADKSQGQEHRAEIRSTTFSGIAEAMAEQWGRLQIK